MANVNIRRDVTDPFYRYKMERLQSKVEGKGNGIKTVVVNLAAVAHQLARPPAYIIKYFGFELGAQTNIDPKDDRWIINGAHESSKLQDHLDGFIKKFVLCNECKNPETVVNIKDGDILLDCKACGKISKADGRQKLSSFILKNAPKKGKKDKSTKKADRKAKREAEKNGNGDDNDSNGNSHPSPNDSGSDHAEDNDGALEAGSDDEFTRKIQAEAQELNEPENKEVEWQVDMSEEAIKARAKAAETSLAGDLKQNLKLDDDANGEDSGASAYDELGKWIEEQAKEVGGVTKVSDIEIYRKAKELGIEAKHRTPAVLAQCLFDNSIVKQLPARAGLLKNMTKHGDKHEKAFLGGIERFVGNDRPTLIPTVSAILLTIYNEEIVTEDVLKAWGSRASKKYVEIAVSKKVRKSAQTFLEWLEKAESEDEDESD